MRDEYKIRKQLDESEEKYRTIVENTLDLIYEVDSKGQILYVNPNCKHITGYEPEELLGKSAFDFIHPDDLLNAKSEFQEGIINLSTGNVTFRAKHKSGEWRWLESTGRSHRTATGEIRGVIITRDVTERKKAEERIAYRLSLESALAEVSQLFISSAEPDLNQVLRFLGEAVGANRAYIIQLHQDGAKADNTHEWCALDTEPQIHNLKDMDTLRFPWWMNKMRAGENVVIKNVDSLPEEAKAEKEFLQQQNIYSLLAVPIISNREELLGFIGFDDTETCRTWLEEDIRLLRIASDMMSSYKIKKQAECALLNSEARFRAIFKKAAVGIALVNLDGRPLVSNPALERMLGRSGEELSKMVFTEFTHPDDAASDWALFEELIEGERHFYQLEKRYYHKDGRVVYGLLTVSLVNGVTVNPPFIIALVDDITTRKLAEEELLARTSQLAAVTDAMTILLEHGSWQVACTLLLKHALHLTESEYGFIGVVMEGLSELRIFAHSGLDWDRNINHDFYEGALRFYDKMGYLVFTNFDNLFGQVITTGQVVISNKPSSDPRAGGLPPGHPPLHSFLGVPIQRETEVVGLIGVANRPGGYTGNEKEKIEILSRAASVLDDNYRRREREAAMENERKRTELQLRNSREELRALSARQESIREEERTRIAREIHDELGETLTGLKIDLSFLQKRLPNDQDSLPERVQSMSGLVSSAIQSIQKISTELRPVVLDELGLTAAIEWQAREFQTRTGIKAMLTLPSNDITLDSELSTAVFRIFQATLTNVARHAQASQVSVSLKAKSGNVILIVEDNGRGIRESEISSPKSMGLIGVRERVHLFGGKFQISGNEGEGTTLIISVPLRRQQGGSE